MIGEKLSKPLQEMEATLWEFEYYNTGKPNYTILGFRGALKVCMSAIMDKMWELQEKENIDLPDREKMATECGTQFMKLVKHFTDIDTHKLYEKPTGAIE
jgi:hypothetical protein